MSLRRFLLAVSAWFSLWLGGGLTPLSLQAADESVRGEGQPFVRTFLPRDYRGYTQCWGVAQDARGVMYIGNEKYVLEYDGATWRKIAVTEVLPVFALAYDPATDRVYVGASNDLGYLELRPNGERAFVSMRERVPAEASDVGNVRAVYVTAQGIFFGCDGEILRWQDGSFKAWKDFGTASLHPGWARGTLYVQSKKTGLLRLENDTFVTASADPLFGATTVRDIVTGPGGSLLVGTLDAGLFIVRDGVPSPYAPECQEYLKTSGILHLQALHDGSLAIGTIRGGVVILDDGGRFRNCLDASGGLPPTGVAGMGEDAEGGLWLGGLIGVTRAEINSPFSRLRTVGTPGLQPEFRVAASFRDQTFLASGSGIFRIVPSNPTLVSSAHLEVVSGSEGNFTDLLEVKDGVLAAGMQGIFFLDAAGRFAPVADEPQSPAFSFCPSRLFPGQVYVGGAGDLRRRRFDPATKRWADAGSVAEIGSANSVYGVCNTGQDDLWLTTLGSGLFRVKPSTSGPAEVKSFLKEPGSLQAETWLIAMPAAGHPLLMSTRHRLYRFDEKAQAFQLDDQHGARLADGSFTFDMALQNDDGSLWLAGVFRDDPSERQVYGILAPNGQIDTPAFRRLPRKIADEVGVVQSLMPVQEQGRITAMLVGGSYGLVRVDLERWAKQGPQRFATLIRRAVATDHGGGDHKSEPLLQEPLPYARNTIHVEFAASTYAASAAPQYQVRLSRSGQGYWSEFEERNRADYDNLSEGSYLFEVRARNADGQMGSTASLAFRILPPWQRTPWAYAIYALAFGLTMWGLVRWRGRQLRRRNVTLESLVNVRTSELRGREAELVTARDAAEGANRAKSAFLANMSHELRTPLNAILGYAQILLGNTALPTRSREQIAVIDQSGEHLLTLINEVLDIAKVEAGKLTLNAADFPLGPLLDEVVATFRPRLAEKGLAFHDERQAALPAGVHTDRDRLRQVLLNLLSNAVKFTRQGSVSLRVGSENETARSTVRFAVEDTGIGISPDELTRIFEAFHQVNDRALAAQGTGLGLAISQRLVQLLGGTLRVESVLGRGSQFWFDLPLASIAMPPVPSEATSPRAAATITGYRGAARRLLIVDDQMQNRRVLCDLLGPLGFALEEAANGTSCLEHCARALPDAVLLDLRLGKPDGFEVARTLRQRLTDLQKPLVIVALSASVFEHDRQQALGAGCDDFLPKPFRSHQVLEVLGRLLTLEWTYAEPCAPDQETSLIEEPGTLSPMEMNTLLVLSGRGDVMGIREQLEAWQADEGNLGRASLASQFLPLVASYQVDELHARLLELQRTS